MNLGTSGKKNKDASTKHNIHIIGHIIRFSKLHVSRTYLKCAKDEYMVTLVKIVGDYGKGVATVVPANLLSWDLEDRSQLPCGHPEHLRLCSPAC